MKKFLAILLTLIMAMSMTSSLAEETVTIYWSQWQTEYTDALKALTDEYAAQHPGVKFEIDMAGGDSVYQNLLAAGQLPDMIMTVGGASTKNWLEHLAPITDQPAWTGLTDFSKEWLTFEGEGWGVPVTMLAYGFIYNVDLFEKAGITETPKSIPELKAAIEKLEAAGITPFATMFGETWWQGHFATETVWDAARTAGEDWAGWIEKLNNEEMDFNDMAQYWDVYFDMLDLMSAHDSYADADTLSGNWANAVAEIVNENAAMIYMGEFITSDFYRANPDINLGVFGVPYSDDAANYRLSVDVNCCWHVTNGPNKDICIDILNWMCSDEKAKDILYNQFPIISPYKDGEYTANKPMGLSTVKHMADGEVTNWIFNNFSRAQMEGLYPDVQLYLLGELSREDTLDSFYEYWLDLK